MNDPLQNTQKNRAILCQFLCPENEKTSTIYGRMIDQHGDYYMGKWKDSREN
jgi:hypothetical protein